MKSAGILWILPLLQWKIKILFYSRHPLDFTSIAMEKLNFIFII
jgi:hypothetical protein